MKKQAAIFFKRTSVLLLVLTLLTGYAIKCLHSHSNHTFASKASVNSKCHICDYHFGPDAEVVSVEIQSVEFTSIPLVNDQLIDRLSSTDLQDLAGRGPPQLV